MGALEGNRIDHHENQRRLVDTIGPFHRCRTCDQRPPEQGGSVRGRELLTERAKRRFSPAAPQDFAWTLIVLPAVRVELTDLQRNLTRRANHWHVFIIARIEPAPGNRSRAFESDGGPGSRLRILPAHHRLGVANELPSEPSIAGTRERAGMRRGPDPRSQAAPASDDPPCGSRLEG